MMKIEIWSDYACPFCHIGKRRLEEALETLGPGTEAEVTHRCYELHPQASAEGTQSNLQHKVAEGATPEEARRFWEKVRRLGRGAGLEFAPSGVPHTNTRDAHRLTLLAQRHGKGKEMGALLFEALMGQGRNIGSHEVLLELAERAGLPAEEARALLQGDVLAQEVLADEREAEERGVEMIPAFFVDGKAAFAGIVRPGEMLEALRAHLRGDDHEGNDTPKGEQGCGGGSCRL